MSEDRSAHEPGAAEDAVVDLNAIPFDVRVRVGGIVVALRTPDTYGDVDLTAAIARSVDGSARDRGVAVRVWRWLFGAPAVTRGREASTMRRLALEVVDQADAPAVRELSVAHCTRLVNAAMGAYTQHMAACGTAAAARLRREAEARELDELVRHTETMTERLRPLEAAAAAAGGAGVGAGVVRGSGRGPMRPLDLAALKAETERYPVGRVVPVGELGVDGPVAAPKGGA